MLTISILVVTAGDWLQGPYVYYLYSTYGFGKGEIGQLFIAGFGSSMLFGTIVGSLADKQWEIPPKNYAVIAFYFLPIQLIWAFNKFQGTKESMRDLLHYLHTQLHHQAFPTVQSFDVGTCTGWYCYLPTLLRIWVLACCWTLQGEGNLNHLW